MINKSIIITALARDCENNLKQNINRIEQLRSHFAKSNVIILENDSKDDTPKILREWETSSKGVRCISEPIPSGVVIESHAKNPRYEEKSLKRISKMAYLRNRLLELSNEMGEFDFYMLLDIDVYSFSVEGVLKAILNAPSDWGGLFANGCYQYQNSENCFDMPVQYDVYAFFKEKEDFLSLDRRYLIGMKQFERARYMSIQANKQDYFSCLSAFGGVGIYRHNLIKDIFYSPIVPDKWKNDNICLCEHLSVNKQILEKGYKCYIVRCLKVNYGMYEKKGLRGLFFRFSPVLYLRICRMLTSSFQDIIAGAFFIQ